MNQFSYLFLICFLLSIPDLLALSAKKLTHPILKSHIPSTNEFLTLAVDPRHSQFYNSKILNTIFLIHNCYSDFQYFPNFLSFHILQIHNPSTISVLQKTSSLPHFPLILFDKIAKLAEHIHHSRTISLNHASNPSGYFSTTLISLVRIIDITKYFFATLPQILMKLTLYILHLDLDWKLIRHSVMVFDHFSMSSTDQNYENSPCRKHFEDILACTFPIISTISCIRCHNIITYYNTTLLVYLMSIWSQHVSVLRTNISFILNCHSCELNSLLQFCSLLYDISLANHNSESYIAKSQSPLIYLEALVRSTSLNLSYPIKSEHIFPEHNRVLVEN